MKQNLVRFNEVQKRVGLSRTTIWRLEKGGQFPKHFKISHGAIAWHEDEIIEWIEKFKIRSKNVLASKN